MTMEDVNESLKEELEALEAILSSEDEFTAKENGRSELCVTTRIFPLTASDTSRQYVGLYLKVVLNKSLYPDQEKPRIIDVFQVRGLNETNIQQLLKNLNTKWDETPNSPILFSLIDECREFLTEHNYPTCPCSICLYHIVEEDAFIKTPCYHYFHSYCFGRYLALYSPISDEYEDDMSYGPKKPKKPDNIIACPVCRTDLVKDEWDPQELLHENEGILAREDGKADKLVRTKSLEDLQRKMKDLWECQKAKQCEKTQATGIIQNR
eukprot:01940.XXX_4580_3610_1 [CDS] Oithona nana genome sequencing.